MCPSFPRSLFFRGPGAIGAFVCAGFRDAGLAFLRRDFVAVFLIRLATSVPSISYSAFNIGGTCFGTSHFSTASAEKSDVPKHVPPVMGELPRLAQHPTEHGPGREKRPALDGE